MDTLCIYRAKHLLHSAFVVLKADKKQALWFCYWSVQGQKPGFQKAQQARFGHPSPILPERTSSSKKQKRVPPLTGTRPFSTCCRTLLEKFQFPGGDCFNYLTATGMTTTFSPQNIFVPARWLQLVCVKVTCSTMLLSVPQGYTGPWVHWVARPQTR